MIAVYKNSGRIFLVILMFHYNIPWKLWNKIKNIISLKITHILTIPGFDYTCLCLFEKMLLFERKYLFLFYSPYHHFGILSTQNWNKKVTFAFHKIEYLTKIKYWHYLIDVKILEDFYFKNWNYVTNMHYHDLNR